MAARSMRLAFHARASVPPGSSRLSHTDITKVLDAIGKVRDDGMHAWSTGNIAQVQIRLACIAVRQHQHPRLAFRTDLELVAPSRFAPALINGFAGDMHVGQELFDEYAGCLYIVSR